MEEDISKLSNAQRNVVVAVASGYNDSTYYVPSTVVSLCRLGLAKLHAGGCIELTTRGHAAAYKLDSDGIWSLAAQ